MPVDYEDEGMGLKVFEIRVTLLHVTCYTSHWNMEQLEATVLCDASSLWTTREDRKNRRHQQCGVTLLMRFLLDHGANVDAKNNKNRTPLHVVLCSSTVGDVHAISILGKTPVRRLFESEDYHQYFFDVAQLLIERGADANTRIRRHTPLHLASRSMNLKLVRVLLDHGANIDARDSWGQTALHQVSGGKDYNDEDGFGVAQVLLEGASRLVLLKGAWLLLKHGADLNAAYKDGKVPFQVARESIREDSEMKKWPSDNSAGRSR
ncbi:ankyrin repeat-containing domain protein [Lactarius pseudohatsudake]|nr:ankyrin repeat-containing domain protein [Lactarius pseudohatsudake]